MNNYKKYVKELILYDNIYDNIYDNTYEPTESQIITTHCPSIKNNTRIPNITNYKNDNEINNTIIIIPCILSIITTIIITYIFYKFYYLKKNKKQFSDDNFGTQLENIIDF